LICSGNSKSPAKHRGCGACPTRDRWSVTFSRLLPGFSDQQPNGPEGAAHDSFLTPFPGCRLTRGRPGRCLGLTCHGPSGHNTNNVGLSGGKHSAAPVGHGLNSFSLIDQERNSKNPISKAGHCKISVIRRRMDFQSVRKMTDRKSILHFTSPHIISGLFLTRCRSQEQ